MTTPPDVDFLRRLAGRIPDDDLAWVWNHLGAGEFGDMERSLVNMVRDHAIPLSDTEWNRMVEAGITVTYAGLAELRVNGHRPVYHFEPSAELSTVDDLLIADVTTCSTLRRVVEARRIPQSAAAPCPDLTVYVAEFAAGESVLERRTGLFWGPGGAQLEVVAEGEELPPYQAAAFAAGRRIRPGSL
ncbi:hypothetical protein [Allokutzneria oryzae]|uniref:Uncharacterized protein n=1 Tax=Allokutzneria oryzae TaxID=1378989 RepID=A0ABV5ZXY4_9PSEU